MTYLLAITLLLSSLAWSQEPGRAFKAAYWTAAGATAGLAIGDIVTSQQGYHNSPTCEEAGSAWILGKRPGAARMSVTFGAEVAGAAVLGWQLRRRAHGWVRNLAWLPLAWSASAHAKGLQNNLGVCQ